MLWAREPLYSRGGESTVTLSPRQALGTIHAHNSPLEVLARELNRVRRCKPRLPEGAQRSEVALLRIGDYGVDVRVREDDLPGNSQIAIGPSPKPVITSSPIARSIPAEVSSAPSCSACSG
jgi:hypothetical protein